MSKTRVICALEGRQKIWQDSVSQDAGVHEKARVGHPVDPVDCLDDEEITAAMDVANALEILHDALLKAEGLFVRIEPDCHPAARLERPG